MSINFDIIKGLYVMKKFATIFLVLFLSSLFLSPIALSAKLTEDSPIGYWKTIDDVTGKPKAIIQIWQSPDKLLFGRIVKVFQRPMNNPHLLCTACDGEKHNQRIIGMTILENLKQTKDSTSKWIDGSILDPKNGKTYHSNMRLL